MRASYTRHAWARVEGRLALTHEEVAILLDHGLTVTIGVEGGRAHRLFYSAPDRMCFVAVQDEVNGAVITVLPIDYHGRCAWRVSPEAQAQARTLILGRPSPSPNREPTSQYDDPTTTPSEAPPVTVRISAYVVAPDGQIRSLNLGAWVTCARGGCLRHLDEDAAFIAEVETRLAEKKRPGERVDLLLFRLGKSGPPFRSMRAWDDGHSDPPQP